MKRLAILVCLTMLAATFYGCSSGSSDAPAVGDAHPAGWISTHGSSANADLRSCQGCHGLDYTGSGDAVSCFNCHSSGPPFSAHPLDWVNVRTDHQGFPNDYNWTTCANGACHGVELTGGTAGPSCFNAANSCHSNTAGDPPAPHAIPFTSPSVHGTPAKADLIYCQNCHGRPLNDFLGGYVADLFSDATPEINVNGNCRDCHFGSIHDLANAHPNNWDGVDSSRAHFTSGNMLSACTICHNVTVDTTPGNNTPGPFPGAPSCYTASWDSPNGTSSCHPNGPSAPHTLDGTYLPGTAHGPDAKLDLNRCRDCHGDKTTDTNPRYNLLIADINATGSIPNAGNGCEGCHNDAAAHPSIGVGMGVPREVVNWYDVDGQRHNNANIAATTCGLCHQGMGGSGTIGGACTGCHVSVPTGVNATGCTSCHGAPPDGTVAPNRAGNPDGDSGDGHAKGAHTQTCNVCHTNNGPGSVSHFTRPPATQQANLRAAPNIGGTTMSFNQTPTNVTCTGRCHGGDRNHSDNWYSP